MPELPRCVSPQETRLLERLGRAAETARGRGKSSAFLLEEAADTLHRLLLERHESHAGTPDDRVILRVAQMIADAGVCFAVPGWFHIGPDEVPAAIRNLDDVYRAHGFPVDAPEPPPSRGPAAGKRSIPRSLRKTVFERDGFRCKHCGGQFELAADHIIPESKGGSTTLENLQTLCKSCNSRKRDRMPSES